MESHKNHVPNHQPIVQGYPSVEVKEEHSVGKLSSVGKRLVDQHQGPEFPTSCAASEMSFGRCGKHISSASWREKSLRYENSGACFNVPVVHLIS